MNVNFAQYCDIVLKAYHIPVFSLLTLCYKSVNIYVGIEKQRSAHKRNIQLYTGFPCVLITHNHMM